ncbi:unnamed protein product [Rotaria sp. Silwood2]|nr:unnamed protein product [Rotaria sp. Silwood2]
MHTVFRIDNVKQIDNKQPLYEVNLILTSDDNQHLSQLTERIHKEIGGSTGWARLGKLLLKIDQVNKAEEVYTVLLEQTSDPTMKVHYYHQLGCIQNNQGEYEKAIEYYIKALEICRDALPSDHPDLAASYNNIGEVYRNMSDYSKALSFYEKAFEIHRKILPPNHPDLATSYNNFGALYRNMGDNSKALSSYEKAREIFEKTLPSNHPDLATCYNNFACVYDSMREYSKALSFFERTRDIRQRSLAPNDPLLTEVLERIEMIRKKL